MNLKIQIRADLLRSLIVNRGIPHEIIANKCGIETETLLKCCRDDSEIEYGTLQKMAKMFKKPWTVFLLEKPEKPVAIDNDNRTINNQGQALGPELVKFIEDAEFTIEVSKEITPDYKISIPYIKMTTDSDPRVAGEKIRSLMISDDTEFKKIHGAREALNYWKQIVQGYGVYISERALPTEQVRAFSLRKSNRAIIVLSTKDSYAARSFSLFHELCHIILNNTGICALNDFESIAVERYCNQFAASFLAPKALIEAILDKVNSSMSPDDLIKLVADQLGVSRAAAAIRLADIGIIPPINSMQLEKLQKRKSKDGRNASGGNYYATTINAAGVVFSKQVFEAVTGGSISTGDAARFLGVGEHIVNRYQSKLYEYHPTYGESTN
jgi:Zn-dependent peptidase ImmA (M78 family)